MRAIMEHAVPLDHLGDERINDLVNQLRAARDERLADLANQLRAVRDRRGRRHGRD